MFQKAAKRGGAGLFVAIAALGLSLSILSCDNSYGILASIQREEKQTGTDIFLKGMVKNIVGDGTAYFASMGRLFVRPASATPGSDAWEPVEITTESQTISSYFCAALTAGKAAGTPEVVTALTAATDPKTLKGIFRTVDQGSTWTALGTTGIDAGSAVQSLFHAGGTLFLSVRRKLEGADIYDLLYYNGTAFVQSGAAIASTRPFVNGVLDGDTFWFVAADSQGSSLYSGTSPATLADITPDGAPTYTGICTDSDGNLYLSTRDGHLMRRLKVDGTWIDREVLDGAILGIPLFIPQDRNTKSTSIRFALGRFDDTSYGYIEYDWNADSYSVGSEGTLVPDESSYSTTISGKPITGFWMARDDAGNTRLFAAAMAASTTTYGLYSNGWVSGSWQGWEAE